MQTMKHTYEWNTCIAETSFAASNALNFKQTEIGNLIDFFRNLHLLENNVWEFSLWHILE